MLLPARWPPAEHEKSLTTVSTLPSAERVGAVDVDMVDQSTASVAAGRAVIVMVSVEAVAVRTQVPTPICACSGLAGPSALRRTALQTRPRAAPVSPGRPGTSGAIAGAIPDQGVIRWPARRSTRSASSNSLAFTNT